MAWISAAALVGGQLLSSNMGAKASQGASDAQVKASDAALLLQNRQNNINAQAAAPYQQAGQEALGSLMGMMGLAAPKTTTPYGYTADAQNTKMGNIYGLMGLGGNGNMLAPPPGRPWYEKAADPGNLFPSSVSSYASKAILNSLGVPGGVFGNPFGGLAHGGTAHSGGTYVVGEKGPEILHMAPGSQGYVEPNSPKADALAYGGPAQGRLFGGPVFGGSHTSAPWSAAQGYASHARPNPLAPTMHMGYMQEGSYKVPGRLMGGPVFGGAMLGPLQKSLDRSDVQQIRNQDFQNASAQGNAHPGGNFTPNSNYQKDPQGPLISINNPQQTESGTTPASAGTPPASTAATSGAMTPDQIIAQDPGYQFRLDQGIKAMDSSAAASGKLFSGAQGIGLQQYGQNYASQEYSNIWNRLASVAGIGQSANANTGYTGAMSASGGANAAMYGGNAAAMGLIGQNNAYQTGFNNLAYLYGSGAFGGGGNQQQAQYVPSGGSGGNMFSDRRLKKDVKQIGKLISGLPVYTFKYIGSTIERIGVMADEVLGKFPEAVSRDASGFLMVDYSRIS